MHPDLKTKQTYPGTLLFSSKCAENHLNTTRRDASWALRLEVCSSGPQLDQKSKTRQK